MKLFNDAINALLQTIGEQSLPTVTVDAFSEFLDYVIGNQVVYDNNVYSFTSNHSAGAWNINHVALLYPIQNITIDGIYEAEEAYNVINVEREKVLSYGLNCNTDEQWEMVPDSQGYIALPSNIIRIDSDDFNVIAKDGKLYNKETKTFKFTDPILCDVVWDIDFDTLPFPVQDYIVKRSARIFYQRLVGGEQVILQLLLQDEQDSKLNMLDHDADTSDFNIFDDNTVSRAINRTTNPVGLRG